MAEQFTMRFKVRLEGKPYSLEVMTMKIGKAVDGGRIAFMLTDPSTKDVAYEGRQVKREEAGDEVVSAFRTLIDGLTGEVKPKPAFLLRDGELVSATYSCKADKLEQCRRGIFDAMEARGYTAFSLLEPDKGDDPHETTRVKGWFRGGKGHTPG